MVCKGLVYIAQHHPALFGGSLPVVIQFLLVSSRHTVYRIRLEALQFWPIAIMNGDWLPLVQTVVPDLLPILMDNMIYSQEDFLNMDEGLLVDDDATVPDRAEDMAPRFHKESSDDGEDIADDDEDLSGPLSTWGSEWTVRKSAASALDHMATAYRDSILPFVLPLIEAKLRSEQWETQECALLALGAIGHGCMQGLSPHLPNILQLLESISKSRKPLLRSISCWTISRFAAWISFDTHREVALPLSLSVILLRMLDQNKRVQEAAVSAFVSVAEEVGMYLEEYLPDIIKAINQGLTYYQSKNLLILLDAIACLFEAMGPEVMSKPEIIQALIPRIVSSFRGVNFATEKQLSLSLFECLTSICTNVGPGIGLDALEFIMRKCTAVLEANINAYIQITGLMSREEKPDNDVLACALDLLCGVLDGLADAAPNVVMKVNFIPIVCKLVSQFEHESKLPLVRNYYSNTVRQCAFALIGDIAKTCSVLLDDESLRGVMTVLIAYVSVGPISVSNNASWAIGEISMRRGFHFIEPFVDSISAALLNNLKRFEASTRPIVRQNAAIALGRLGLVASAKMISSGIFPEMFDAWCEVIKKLRTDGEKLTAVKGFTLCVEASPRTALSKERLKLLFEMIASMNPPPTPLEMSLKSIILMYRQMLGVDDWASLWTSFPIEIQYRINQAYALGMEVAQQSANPGLYGSSLS
jgi:transportin-1